MPTSGDPTTFRTYNTGVDYVLDVGGGLYTATSTNAGLEIQRHHANPNIAFQDEVFFLGAPTFGGTGTFPAFSPGPPQTLIHFVDLTAANVLPDTLIANWPQTVAAWSAGFAGIELFLQDGGNFVGYRGRFLTLGDAPPSRTRRSPPRLRPG